ncbi:MAG: NifU N-terminal domain-containing protein [Patescibacteria group bacterium]|nr:NifU N-terminal domain-containing protein [Patescibacteria group bacterium]
MGEPIKNKIIVQTNPNPADPDTTIYHVTKKISNSSLKHFQSPWNIDEDLKKTVGRVGATLLRKVMNIPGVTDIFIKTYELSVTKGKAFDDEVIKSQVIEALKEVFGDEAKQVEVVYL